MPSPWTGTPAYSDVVGRVTRRAPALRYEVTAGHQPRVVRRPDTLAVEEPMEIRVDGEPLTVTMRTPGDDFDLTLGFLHGEGLIGHADDVARLMHCLDTDDDGSPTYNVVDVTLRAGVSLRRQREARVRHHQRVRCLRHGQHRRPPDDEPVCGRAGPRHGRPGGAVQPSGPAA